MTDQMVISKSDLLKVLRTCLHPPIEDYEEVIRFKTYLKTIVSQILHNLCSCDFKDVDTWLLSSRVGIIGMQYLTNNERFYKILDTVWEMDHAQRQIVINEFHLDKNVENVDTFKASVCYGFMNLLSRYTCLFPEKETRKLYDILFEYSVRHNQHYQLYYQLLAQYVDTFPCLLKPVDFDNIFTLLYFNLEKKESSTLLRCVLGKCENYNVDVLFHILTENSTWTSKHKYVLLNEIFLYEPTMLYEVHHEDFSTGLIYGLTKPHLSSASAKLYYTVIKLIHEHLWRKYYYPSFNKIITAEEKPTVCYSNLFKYFLPKTFERFPNYYMELLDAVQNKPACASTLMTLVLIGKRQSLLSSDFDYDSIIDSGINHCDQVVRNMAFEILCLTRDYTTEDTLNKVKNFLIMNINAADQPNREMLKKTVDNFLKKLQQAFTKKRNRILEGEMNIADFLKWLITYLLNSFHELHNYQRITLSFQLIKITLRYFSIPACANMKSDKLKTFMETYRISNNVTNHLRKFVQMLCVCGSERDQVLELIVKQFSPQDLLNSNVAIDRVILDAKRRLVICNREESEMGEKLAEFAIKFMASTFDPILERELHNIQELMKLQWQLIKYSVDENVVANGNPLHSLISLTSTLLPYYDKNTYDTKLLFVEDVVYSLLNVFEIRAMVPFTSEFCTGVAKVFKNETSDVFACTVNCMWLTLKACCKLAAKITNILETDVMMYRTLELIFSIIRRCYHKGALEVAGSTLSDLVAHATKKEHNISVIDRYTNNVLDQIPNLKQDNSSSTVRRAAEIRIFLSALAVSDKRLNMPLFHKIMVVLVSFLSKCILQIEHNPMPVSHCVILHTLKPIVLDTAVEVPIVEYVGIITLYCLQSFESTDWSVRNAAIQTFSAVTNKIHGQNISSNDAESQQHAINLEEIFFRYPRVFNYMLLKLSESSENFEANMKIAIPILTFLGLSYVRGNEFTNLETRTQLDMMTRSITGIIHGCDNPLVFMIAIKAFVALTSHKALEGEIEKIIEHLTCGQQLTKNRFLAYIFTVKLLFEKVAENAQASMRKNSILESIEAHMFSLLLMTKHSGDALEIVIAGLLLVGENSTHIDVEQTYAHITFAITYPSILHHVPMIWTWIEKHLTVVLSCANLGSLFDFIIRIMSISPPTEIIAICFKQMTKRASHSQEDKQLCSIALLNTLIMYLYDSLHTPVKYLADLCIQLVLVLDIADVDENLFFLIKHKLLCIEENSYHDTYIIISCMMTLQFSQHNPETVTFYYWCVDKCNEYLDDDNIELLIFKSVIYITKYATRYTMTHLKLRTLQVCYRMLQLGMDELNTECAEILAFCFNKAPTYAYANMLDLVNPACLLPYLGLQYSLRFLILTYINQTETRPVARNVFENKPVLSIETCIVSPQILENIKTLLVHATQTEAEMIFVWFAERTDLIYTKYVCLMRTLLARFYNV